MILNRDLGSTNISTSGVPDSLSKTGDNSGEGYAVVRTGVFGGVTAFVTSSIDELGVNGKAVEQASISFDGQQHSKKFRVQPRHLPSETSSSHFFLRLRHVRQPLFVRLLVEILGGTTAFSLGTFRLSTC